MVVASINSPEMKGVLEQPQYVLINIISNTRLIYYFVFFFAGSDQNKILILFPFIEKNKDSFAIFKRIGLPSERSRVNGGI